MTESNSGPPAAQATTSVAQQARLAKVFVVLADTLVADFDVADLLDLLVRTCVDVLGATAAGLLLSDHQGVLRVAASSSEATALLEAFQLQAEEGPCLDAFHTRRPVVADLTANDSPWPTFAGFAVSQGLRGVSAIPMRLREQSIGALNLFYDQHRPEIDLRVAQALADVATIGILHQQGARAGDVVIEQLQAALNSRVIIEQAKGVLAATGHIDMDMAFQQLRRYARDHNAKLSLLAGEIAAGTLQPVAVIEWRRPPR
jgi:GAF domain-containing protein